MNVAPTELGMFYIPLWVLSLTSHADLTNAKKNWNKTAGYTEVETTAFKNILELPDDPNANRFVDVWRNMHPEDQQYTYFSYRFDCRVKGIGWRIDMCMCFISVNLNLVKPIYFFRSYSCSERKIIWPCQDGKQLILLKLSVCWFTGVFLVWNSRRNLRGLGPLSFSVGNWGTFIILSWFSSNKIVTNTFCEKDYKGDWRWHVDIQQVLGESFMSSFNYNYSFVVFVISFGQGPFNVPSVIVPVIFEI